VSKRNRDGFGLGVLGSCLVMALLLDLGFTVEMRMSKPTQELTQVDVEAGPVAVAPSHAPGRFELDRRDDAVSQSRRAPVSVPTRAQWHAKPTVRR
jgi:hypothetical protein